MGTLRLIAHNGGASGKHTIVTTNSAPSGSAAFFFPSNGRQDYIHQGEPVAHTWNGVTLQSGVSSVGVAKMQRNAENIIPLGWYWIGNENSGVELKISVDSTGMAVGPLRIGNTEIGLQVSIGGSPDPDRVFVFVWRQSTFGNALVPLWSTTANDSPLGVGFYPLGFAFVFTGLEELEDQPYAPDSNDATGTAGDPDGDGGKGTGLPTANPSGVPTTKTNKFPLGNGLHAYVLTAAQISSFLSYLWGSDTTVFGDTGLWGRFKNYKYNPIAGVVSCHMLPLGLMPASAGSSTIQIAGTTLANASGAVITSQWKKSDTFPLYINDVLGMFAQYSAASLAVYLPFCGVVPVDVSAVVGAGGMLEVEYWCDTFTGNVAAYVIGTTPSNVGQADYRGVRQVLKIATGNAAYRVPLTGNDNGAGEVINNLKTAISSGITGNVGGLVAAGVNIVSGSEQHHTEVIGSINGNAGWAASDEIFAIANWPIPMYSADFNDICGRVSEASATIASFSGYCEFEMHADITNATAEEKAEIESLCASGVIV